MHLLNVFQQIKSFLEVVLIGSTVLITDIQLKATRQKINDGETNQSSETNHEFNKQNARLWVTRVLYRPHRSSISTLEQNTINRI